MFTRKTDDAAAASCATAPPARRSSTCTASSPNHSAAACVGAHPVDVGRVPGRRVDVVDREAGRVEEADRDGERDLRLRGDRAQAAVRPRRPVAHVAGESEQHLHGGGGVHLLDGGAGVEQASADPRDEGRVAVVRGRRIGRAGFVPHRRSLAAAGHSACEDPRMDDHATDDARRLLAQPVARRGRRPAPHGDSPNGCGPRDHRRRAARGHHPRGDRRHHGRAAGSGRGVPAAAHRWRRRDLLGRAHRSRDAGGDRAVGRPPRRQDLAGRRRGARQRLALRRVRSARAPAVSPTCSRCTPSSSPATVRTTAS